MYLKASLTFLSLFKISNPSFILFKILNEVIIFFFDASLKIGFSKISPVFFSLLSQFSYLIASLFNSLNAKSVSSENFFIFNLRSSNSFALIFLLSKIGIISVFTFIH